MPKIGHTPCPSAGLRKISQSSLVAKDRRPFVAHGDRETICADLHLKSDNSSPVPALV
ncbi:MAG: hypothetical protein IKN27_02635 [Selenomonadaceae bacterium]|nr:hypothetical protein [Selenomonadaceae bacterium]